MQEYFLNVVPEWYSPDILSGEGDLATQICEYEKTRAQYDGMYLLNLKPGSTTVEVVQELKEENPSETSESNPQEQSS